MTWIPFGRFGGGLAAAQTQARRLGFGQHFFALGHLRVLADLALEQRDLNTAEHLTERVLSIAGAPAAQL